MLLCRKKLLAFYQAGGRFWPILLFSALLIFPPRSSQASILSALARFFGVYTFEVEERLPNLVAQSQAASGLSALDAGNRPPDANAIDYDDANALNIVEDNAILAPLNPLGTIPVADGHAAGQIFVYVVRSGDNISTIAKSFGVSVNTILWANSISDLRSIKSGDQLLILPVTGIRHEVKKGDTLSSVAKKYRATVEDITRYNGLAAGEELEAGTTVVVPNGELSTPSSVSGSSPGRYFSNLPLYEGFYVRPISGGRRSRGIHGFNGVDLANACGLPVSASADGKVLIAKSSGWNGGYGKYAVISHANGTQTLYAHLKDLAVEAGETVRQEQVLGSIGSTGNSTGCHVHFEVRGARNPF